MVSRLNIWTNTRFPEPLLAWLREAVRPHVLINSPPADGSLREMDIAFGQPDPAEMIASGRLKWVHITSAGYTRYDREDVRAALRARGAVLTNSSHVYDEPCAQHVLAMMLSFSRQLPGAWEIRKTTRDWEARKSLAPRMFLLRGQAVLLYGFGAIAQRLAAMLGPFGVRMTAFRRRPMGREAVPTLAIERADELLGGADHVVDTLPDNASTRLYFNAERIGQMKRGAFFYNIGRGATVDQAALVRALQEGKLGGAGLDVTTPEPLAAGDPLWTAPNCVVTPHVGGAHMGERERMVEHFLGNFGRFVRGEMLVDRVF